MQLVRWNPRNALFNFQSGMKPLFDDFFLPALRNTECAGIWEWNPVVDIYENDSHIVLKAELPGVDKKDIHIDVKDRVLTVKGERSADNEVKEDNYYRRERSFGGFERTFTLPADVNPDSIKADYKDGILKLEIPKPEQHKPKRIMIH